jgi:hypothetical protein
MTRKTIELLAGRDSEEPAGPTSFRAGRSKSS